MKMRAGSLLWVAFCSAGRSSPGGLHAADCYLGHAVGGELCSPALDLLRHNERCLRIIAAKWLCECCKCWGCLSAKRGLSSVWRQVVAGDPTRQHHLLVVPCLGKQTVAECQAVQIAC